MQIPFSMLLFGKRGGVNLKTHFKICVCNLMYGTCMCSVSVHYEKKISLFNLDPVRI